MKILLADDHSLFCSGMEMIIKNILPISEIMVVGGWKEVHRAIRKDKFDIALLDLFMLREKTWEEELELVVQCDSSLPICVITASNLKSHVGSAFRIGVKGFIHKTSGIVEVEEAILKIIEGKYYIPDDCDEVLVRGRSKNVLTARQKEVLSLLVEGRKNKNIALSLGISESTVKRHVYDIFQLLGTHNRVETGILAKEQGLLL